MIVQGTVRDGIVVLQPGVHLPDGLQVTVQPAERQASPVEQVASVTRNGVPVFAAGLQDSAPGLQLVNQLRDEAT